MDAESLKETLSIGSGGYTMRNQVSKIKTFKFDNDPTNQSMVEFSDPLSIEIPDLTHE